MPINDSYSKMYATIVHWGMDVNRTRELLNFKENYYIENYDQMLSIKLMDYEKAFEIVNKLNNKKFNRKIGNYDLSKYKGAMEQFEELAKRYKNDSNKKSRQYVINFGQEHCFQSIQFLNRTTNVVIVNMRSCDYVNNYLYDLFLSYILGNMLFKDKRMILSMNVGSLHIYHKDLNKGELI